MNSWMTGPLQGLFVRDLQSSDSTTANVVDVDIVPFDLTLALTGSLSVDVVVLTMAVSSWMEDNFEDSNAELFYKYDFERVTLRELVGGVRSQSSFKITYDGRSYWKTNAGKAIPTDSEVGVMQLNGLEDEDQNSLLSKLQALEDYTGLGSAVVVARADLNREAAMTQPPAQSGSSSVDSIIIAAIVIAVLASLLLAFALFMAWRSGRLEKERNMAALELETDGERTGDDTPPQDIYGTKGSHAENVIADDISSSLSAYYKQGMTGGYRSNRDQTGFLNDAASVSSMESYGYSLDGYASSIANN